MILSCLSLPFPPFLSNLPFSSSYSILASFHHLPIISFCFYLAYGKEWQISYSPFISSSSSSIPPLSFYLLERITLVPSPLPFIPLFLPHLLPSEKKIFFKKNNLRETNI